MGLFKTIDDRIADAGYVKAWENEFGARYERQEAQNYIHVVDIVHKRDGSHIIQSYDKERFDSDLVGNVCVGLTYKEARLFLKKMKQMRMDD